MAAKNVSKQLAKKASKGASDAAAPSSSKGEKNAPKSASKGARKKPLPRVLAMRFNALGDVVLTTGVLDWWHKNRGLTFHMATRERFAPIFENHPAVERVAAIPEEKMKGLAFLSAARQLVDEYQSKHHRKFEGNTALLDLHGGLRARLVKNLWTGLEMVYPKFGFWRRLYRLTGSARAERELLRYNVPQRYSLAIEDEAPPASALVPRLYLSDAERSWSDKRLAALREAASLPRSDKLIALHPYATHPLKAWPTARWRELTAILDAAGLPWLVLGRNETPLFPGDPRDLTNATDLRQTMALLARASVLVTGDSGPMHLACGVDTPVVALFGPTARVWGFYPAGPRDVILESDMACRPCALHGQGRCDKNGACLADIAAERVFAATEAMLAG